MGKGKEEVGGILVELGTIDFKNKETVDESIWGIGGTGRLAEKEVFTRASLHTLGKNVTSWSSMTDSRVVLSFYYE